MFLVQNVLPYSAGTLRGVGKRPIAIGPFKQLDL